MRSIFESVPVKAHTSGTHRTRSPAETVREYSRHMSKMGITRLANVTGLDNVGIPVFMSIRPNSRCLTVSQGKGIDVASAKASALMESIEFWHSENIAKPVRYESFQALSKEAEVVDIFNLHSFPERRSSLAATPIAWLEGYDLVKRREVWVPYDTICMNTVIPYRHRALCPSSNGLSSGNTMLEAVVHGIAEVIERDNYQLFLHHFGPLRARSRQLNCSTVEDALCRDILRRLHDAALHVLVWDVREDLDVPTFSCRIWDRPGWRQKGVFPGHGAHLAPQVALLRALTEAVQVRLTYISGARDDLPTKAYSGIDKVYEEVTQIASESPSLDFRTFESSAGSDFQRDLDVLLSRVVAAGFESVIAVDLSRSDVDVPVVKIIIPGTIEERPLDQLGRRASERLGAQR